MQRTIEEMDSTDLRRLSVERRKFERNKRLKEYQKFSQDSAGKNTQNGFASPFTQVTHEELSGKIYLTRQKPWVSKFLLVIEVLAVLGLIAILYSGVLLVKNLNFEVQSAMSRSLTTDVPVVNPTPAPTDLFNPISAVVLPSGHTIPNESGESSVNTEELPEDWRELIPSHPTDNPITAPVIPDYGLATRIAIEKIEVDAPIVQGDSWEDLKLGVGQHPGTAHPGMTGNMVLSGHNDIYGEVFRHLDKLEAGDTIRVFAEGHEFIYTVNGSRIVEPTDVAVMFPTSSPTLTLVSCYPYLIDNKRIIITADLTLKP